MMIMEVAGDKTLDRGGMTPSVPTNKKPLILDFFVPTLQGTSSSTCRLLPGLKKNKDCARRLGHL